MDPSDTGSQVGPVQTVTVGPSQTSTLSERSLCGNAYHSLGCEYVHTISDDYPLNAYSGILNDKADYASVYFIQRVSSTSIPQAFLSMS